MADTFIELNPGSAGAKIDARSISGGDVREVVVLGDGTTDTAIAPVTLANGLLVDVSRLTGNVTVVQGTAANLKVDPSGVTSPVQLAAGTALAGQMIASQETGTLYNGSTALTPKYVIISCGSSGTNNLLAAVTSKKIRVLAYNFITNGAVNVKFVSDAAGSPANKTGLKYCVANMGIVAPYNPLGWFETVAGKTLDIDLSAAIAIGGELLYVEV